MEFFSFDIKILFDCKNIKLYYIAQIRAENVNLQLHKQIINGTSRKIHS